MPRLPINYQNTIIYQLKCKDTNVSGCYVGHTTDFKIRKNQHKTACNCESKKAYNYKVYKTMRDNGGFENYDMLEIEKYPCNNENEAKLRERHFYDVLDSQLNSIKPILTEIESSVDYQQRYNREYHAKNMEKIKEQVKAYAFSNKEKIKQYQIDNRDAINTQRKIYTELNKEKILETQQAYRLLHKDELKEKKRIYNLANKEKNDEYNRLRREANRDEINEKQRLFRQENREEVNAKRRLNPSKYYENNKDAINEKRRLKRIADKELNTTSI